jgi:hypothetical protein
VAQIAGSRGAVPLLLSDSGRTFFVHTAVTLF